MLLRVPLRLHGCGEVWSCCSRVCVCVCAGGKEYSAYFVIFKRVVPERRVEVAADFRYAVNFAIVDVANKKYYCDSQLEERAMGLFKSIFEVVPDVDSTIQKSIVECLGKGKVPLPEHAMPGLPSCRPDVRTLPCSSVTGPPLDAVGVR